ncbi:MAG: sigma-70 family RNA polymerase sigma factor, partial [Acidobacteria bacterium]|nr:sigma-70 family RNA polymerase sigma factor [Acidobacteriota bacterium]
MVLVELQNRDLAIEDFLDRLQPRLRGILAQYRIPPEDAEDVLQQALLALVYKWGEIRGPEGWLLGTLRHKCLMYWRSRRRSLYQAVDAVILEFLADADRPEQERLEIASDLNSLVARLPQRCREVLRLRYHLGYDPPEVAERLGYSPTSISKVTNRCLATLNRALVDDGLSRLRPPLLASRSAASAEGQVRTP